MTDILGNASTRSFIRKPQAVGAVQWFAMGDHAQVMKMLATPEGEERHTDAMEKAWGDNASVFHAVRTAQGYMQVRPGDWIITTADGQTYPCSAEDFARDYAPADHSQDLQDEEVVDPVEALRGLAGILRQAARDKTTDSGVAVAVDDLQTVLGGAADEIENIIGDIQAGEQRGPVVVGEVAGSDVRSDGKFMLYVTFNQILDVGTRLFTAPPVVVLPGGPDQGIDPQTAYLGVLWRHAAASFRNDEEAQERWADIGDRYHRLAGGNPIDYKDGAKWMAHCVAGWPKEPCEQQINEAGKADSEQHPHPWGQPNE